MKNPQRWLLVLVVYVSSACAQEAARPGWAKDLPNLPSRPGFYQGLGIVQSTSDADAVWKAAAGKARTEVAAQFRVRITSVIERTVQEKALNDQRQLSEAFQSTTQQYAEATLEGVSIERWYGQDTKTFYAFAAISKEDVGVGEGSQYLEQMTDATKTVVSTSLSGSHIKTQKQSKDGNVWRAYVLAEYPIGAAHEAFIQQIRKNDQMYARFRSTQTFKKLDDEVQKYEEWKKQQKETPK